MNQNLSRIIMERGVVKGDGQIWLMLGEVVEGYEPIVVKENKFHVSKSAHAACAVLRVTGYGASAYANFYGRRLPSREEWLYAFVKGGDPGQKGEDVSLPGERTDPVATMHPGMHEKPEESAPSFYPEMPLSSMPSPVLLSKPNALGIRGLDGKTGEWVLEADESRSNRKDKIPEYAILGSLGLKPGAVPSVVLRQPWEAFEGVGFRCVQNAGRFKGG